MPDENDIVYKSYGFDIFAFFERVFASIGTGLEGGPDILRIFIEAFSYWWNIYALLAILFSLACIAGFIYAKIRVGQLLEHMEEGLDEEHERWLHLHGGGSKENNRWHDIETNIQGDNPPNWRLAIIEADILLEEALEERGYIGTTIGDKLKNTGSATLHSVQDAWDAHKVRNQIAHEGADFVLTKRIATETITKYERVLRELGAL